MSPPKLSAMPYSRPDVGDLERSFAERSAAWASAGGAAAQLDLIRAWDREGMHLDTVRHLAMLRFEQDTRDPEARAEKDFFDDLAPRVSELTLDFVRGIVESPWRQQLEDELGRHALDQWELALQGFDPVIADDRRAESRLKTRYTQLLASMDVRFRGRELTMSELAAYFGDADRATRLEAQQVRFAACDAHREELDSIYDDLVRLRHAMAGKLGHGSYVDLGYVNMRRTDYGPREVAAFRKQVRQTVVPLASRIRRRHAEALGVSDPAFHDHGVRDLLGVPRPKGGHDWMLDRAAELFARLGTDFSELFSVMRECELLDLESREGKAGGGFCMSLPDHRVPVIFANFNGTDGDVRVFTHECGHAFQAYRSMRAHELSAYHRPTSESAEIHSMSLELLAGPHVDLFFGEDADRFRQGHLEQALLFLPYGAAVDEFQHAVYEQPSLTPDERAALWKDLEATYLPERRYVDMPFAESGRFWQGQRHVYLFPFYYIDYCLAQTCALQVWHRARADREDAMEAYRRLCELGGSKPFTALLAEVDLTSPFEAGCLEEIAAHVEHELEL